MVEQYVAFFVLAFLFNFVWEAWHAAWLYQGFDPIPGRHAKSLRGFVRLITRVSLTDAIILMVIWLGGAMIWRTGEWYQDMNAPKYVYFIGVCLLWAAAIEYKAVFLFHQWAYNKNMPKVFGLGLSPLVQLAITGLMACFFIWFG